MDKEIHVWQIVDSNYLFTVWLTYLHIRSHFKTAAIE